MKSKLFLILALTAIGAFTGLAFRSVKAQGKEEVPAKELLAKAKVTRAEAEKTALAAVPGAAVKKAELEDEDGGLRWSFDLATPGSKKITEVGVDAITGKVVENKVESAKEEAEEKKHDKGKKEKKEKGEDADED